MANVIMEIDSACASSEGLTALVAEGKVVERIALLNRRWEDYSGLNLAEQMGWRTVKQNIVGDDTASILILTVQYPSLSLEMVSRRLDKNSGIASYVVSNSLQLTSS